MRYGIVLYNANESVIGYGTVEWNSHPPLIVIRPRNLYVGDLRLTTTKRDLLQPGTYKPQDLPAGTIVGDSATRDGWDWYLTENVQNLLVLAGYTATK